MRVKISKTKNNEYIAIIKSVRIGSKTTTKTVENLGNVKSLLPRFDNDINKVYEYANKRAIELTKKENEDKEEVILKLSQSKRLNLDEQHLYNGGYLFLQDILYDLGIKDICNKISLDYKFEYDLEDILAKLIYTRILYPSSKLSSFKESDKFLEEKKFELQHIYRALDVLSKNKEFIESSLYHNSTKLIKRNTSVLYYDCTNFFFETEEENGLRQYGKSKEHRPSPIVQMGLFMDGNGIPLSMCINPGNTNEQKTLKPLEETMIKDFKLSKFIVCTDAGLGSLENRVFNNKTNRSYIVTQSLKKLKDHLKTWALDEDGFKLNGSNKTYSLKEINENKAIFKDKIFYKERWINENNLEQRLIVSYSLKYKEYQESIRNNQVDRARKLVDNNLVDSYKNPNSSKRFINETSVTKDGEVAEDKTLSINEDRIKEESRYDGFYAVCTTLEDPIEEIININKNRWEIEESFRIMKTEFKSRPVYLNKDDHIKAHFITCFIALLVYRILEKKLDSEYTTKEIITTLKDLNFIRFTGEGYVPTYTRTDITDKLHEVFDFRTDNQIVSNKNMLKIIRKTKR